MWNSSNRSSSCALLLALCTVFVHAAPPVPTLLLAERGSIDRLLASAPPPWKTDAKFAAILRAIAVGYPKDLKGVEFPAGGGPRVLLANGTALTYDDGKEKTFDQKLDAPDLEDTFSQVYPLANPTDRLPENFDPGRFRIEPMFMALYGDSDAAVRAGCTKVDFCGQTVAFSSHCGAAEALSKVADDLKPLAAKDAEVAAYLTKLGGTFNWRKVAGTERLSNHSFATAIDLNVDKSAYWRWQPADKLPTFSRLKFPRAIIEAFERHGFIWGGKWYHYDTMHFEYRPELIAFARAQKAAPAK